MILIVSGNSNLGSAVARRRLAKGRPVKVSRVPVPVLRVMYRLIRPFHPGLSQIMQAAIIGDTTDQTFDPAKMLERFPIDLTHMDEFVQESAGKWETAQAAAPTHGLART